MKIHEYQAKELFRKYGVPVPEGRVAFSAGEAVEAAGTLGGYPVVVKAQIHAGGLAMARSGIMLRYSSLAIFSPCSTRTFFTSCPREPV